MVALLMACAFSSGQDQETITFHSNQHIEDYEDEAGNPWLADEDDEPGSTRFIWWRRGEARLRFCSCSYSPAHEWTPKTLTTRPRSTWPTWKK